MPGENLMNYSQTIKKRALALFIVLFVLFFGLLKKFIRLDLSY
jgi:hypothetical protein